MTSIVGNNHSQISSEAQLEIKKRIRFDQYLSPEIWIEARKGFDEAMMENSLKAKEKFLSSVEEMSIGGCKVLKLTPNSYQKNDKILIYCHGGALTLGSPECTLQIPAPVSDKTGLEVISVDYPLAPYDSTEDTHPAHTAVLNVYKELLKTYDASKIGIIGDSAGANLALGMALLARDENLSLPGAILVYYPWLDLEQTSTAYSDQERIGQTIVLTPENLASARDAAFGLDSELPQCANLLKANFKGFEDTSIAIYTAGRDLLKSEGEALSETLKSTAKRVETYNHEGLWHGFLEGPLELPEADESAKRAADFLLQNLSN